MEMLDLLTHVELIVKVHISLNNIALMIVIVK
jgi:hypothetical protein